MARPRLELQQILETIMDSRNVYYQPPESLKMSYPCIRYRLNTNDSTKADDIKYLKYRRYEVILIDRNPDSQYVDPIFDLPMCSFDRSYTADNLHHFVYTLYF